MSHSSRSFTTSARGTAPGPTATPSVRFAAVNKFFGSHHVLIDIDMALKRGEKLVICGPSGCGKSTMLRCVNRLEAFQSGVLEVNGQQLAPGVHGLFAAPRGVGMVFQNFNLFPHISVLENCIMAPVAQKLMQRDQAADLAMKLLDRVRVADQASKFPGQLSGGQQQRVAIARALCLRPDVMLLDEPTSALDPEMVHGVLDIIESLASEGMTMMMVTHEMRFARRVADRIAFMDAGRVIECLPPDDFFSDRASERARTFVAQVMH